MKLLLSLYMLSALSLTSFGEESKCQNHLTHANKHTFALTSLDTKKVDGGIDALHKHAANACYQNCHSAGLMTLSKNYWNDHTPITLLDRAISFLIESGFFQVNQTYFLNQIVIADEGPNGLGCLLMDSASDFSLHSLDDPACNSTQTVVCGMPGTQAKTTPSVSTGGSGNNTIVVQKNDTINTINPDKDAESDKEPVINISSGVAEVITRATSNDGNGSINGTAVDQQISPSDNNEKIQQGKQQNKEQVRDQEKEMDDADMAEDELLPPVESPKLTHANDTSPSVTDANTPDVSADTSNITSAIPPPDEHDLVYPLSIGNVDYKVVRLQNVHSTTESAATMCQDHHDKIGSLYSQSIPAFSSWFQRVHPMGKTVIGSWNGDSYGANGPQCLIYSAAQGVHLGDCTGASILLCESTLLTPTEIE